MRGRRATFASRITDLASTDGIHIDRTLVRDPHVTRRWWVLRIGRSLIVPVSRDAAPPCRSPAGLRRASQSAAASGAPLAEPPREQVFTLPRSATLSLALVATEIESTRRRTPCSTPATGMRSQNA